MFLDLVTLIALHFLGWNVTPHFFSHLAKLFRSSCMNHGWTQSGRSFIKTKNSSGPKTVPLGTPLRTSTLSDVAPSTVTCCVLCVKKVLIQSKEVPLTP